MLSIIIAVLVGLVYWLIQPAYLHWDPIQFALSLTHFNMALHRPHPPGYLLHIAIAWILKFWGLSPQHAVIGASVLVSGAVVLIVWLFLSYLQVNSFLKLLFSLSVAMNPLMLSYGSDGSVYPLDALFFPLLVLLAVWVLKSGKERALVTWFVLWGLAGGARQNITLFLLPMAVYLLARQGFRPVLVLKALVAALLGIFAWLVPLVYLAGGIHLLLDAFSAQFFTGWGHTLSLLYGAPWPMVRMNLVSLLRWSLLALNLFILLIPFAFFGKNRNVSLLVLLLGILPPYAWFILMYIGKPGHMLFLVPLSAVLAGLGAQNILDKVKDRHTWLVLAKLALSLLGLFILIIQAWQFFAGPAWIYRLDAPVTYRLRAYSDARTHVYLQTIRQAETHGPVMVACRDGYLSFRQAMFYLPEIPVIWLIDRESTGLALHGTTACFARHRRMHCLFRGPFWKQRRYHDLTRIPVPADTNLIFFSWESHTGFGRMAKRILPLQRLSSQSGTPFFLWAVPWRHHGFRIDGYVFTEAKPHM